MLPLTPDPLTPDPTLPKVRGERDIAGPPKSTCADNGAYPRLSADPFPAARELPPGVAGDKIP